MDKPMTPQERAADVIETWKTYDPTGFRIGHLTQLIEDAIKRTRRAALLEAAEFLKLMPMLTKDNAIAVLTKLAQEG